MKKPLALIIMDGFGLRKETEGNAIAAAKHPTLDRLWETCPHTQIGASGLDVGLPDGQMGNSEVGHTNMGAGRIVYQELTRITKSIEEGEYLTNPALVHAMENAKKPGAALHLMGLLSDGGVHSHNRHLYGLIEMAKKSGVEKVFIHCFMDGRDVPPTSGAEYIDELQAGLDKIGVGKIATVSGRYYAMDRDNRWERVVKAYDAMVNGEGVKAPDPVAMMWENYKNGVTDEFTVPAVVTEGAEVKSGDSVIFFNFRPDRARELTRALVDPDFAGFRRKKGFFPLVYICMTQYDATMPNVEVAYLLQQIEEHDGVCILATNLIGNIDAAFMRRITYVVRFPFPDAAMRREIYRRTIPAQAPLAEDVDWDFLAEKFPLSGRHIKNIVLSAAFLAALEGVPLGMSQLLRSAVGEMKKNDIVVVREELREYADLLDGPQADAQREDEGGDDR